MNNKQYPRESFLEWEIGDISEDNANGVLEFKIQGTSDDDFFPTTVEFESENTFANSNVLLILSIGDL